MGCRWVHTAASGTDVHQGWETAVPVAAAEARPGESTGTVHAISFPPHLTGYTPEALERTWPDAFAHLWGEILYGPDGQLHQDRADAGRVTLSRAIPVIDYRTPCQRAGTVEDDPVVRVAAVPSSVAGCPLLLEGHESAEARDCPTDSVCDEPDDTRFSPVDADGAYRVCWVFTTPLELDVTALTGDPVAYLSSRDDVDLLARTDRRVELPVGRGAPLTA